jgi:serine/threonine protein kinase
MMNAIPKIIFVKENSSDHGVMIGSGTEATVYLGRAEYMCKSDTQKCQLIALKTPSSPSFSENLKKEAQILSRIAHPNIVQMIGVSGTSNPETLPKIAGLGTVLPLEISIEGNLFELIFNSKVPLPTGLAKYYFLQLLNGIEAIHSRGVIHRDLKLENFLLFESGAIVKISDFGLSEVVSTETFNSKDLQKTYSSSKLAGSLPYMSPECHVGRFSTSTDLFSLAVSGFIMVFGVPPFGSAKSTDKHYKTVATGNMKEYTKILLKSTKLTQEQLDYDFLELFFSMVHPSSEQRPAVCDIRKSSWLRDGKIYNPEEAKAHVSRLVPKRYQEYMELCSSQET